MIDILLVARNHLLTALRERITLFWFLVFPVFLLVILAVVFGQIGQEGEISFEVSLVNLDPGSSDSYSAMLESVFDGLAQPEEPGQEPLLQLLKPGDGEDPNAFLQSEILAVRRGRRAALIVISEGLTRRIESWLTLGGPSTVDESSAGSLVIYFSEGNAASGMAVSITVTASRSDTCSPSRLAMATVEASPPTSSTTSSRRIQAMNESVESATTDPAGISVPGVPVRSSGTSERGPR